MPGLCPGLAHSFLYSWLEVCRIRSWHRMAPQGAMRYSGCSVLRVTDRELRIWCIYGCDNGLHHSVGLGKGRLAVKTGLENEHSTPDELQATLCLVRRRRWDRVTPALAAWQAAD